MELLGVIREIYRSDLRCSTVNLDPDTAQSDPRLLKATAELNTVCAGVYGVLVRTGRTRDVKKLFEGT